MNNYEERLKSLDEFAFFILLLVGLIIVGASYGHSKKSDVTDVTTKSEPAITVLDAGSTTNTYKKR